MQKFLKELISPLFKEKHSYRAGGSPLSERPPSGRGCLGGTYAPIYMKCISGRMIRSYMLAEVGK